MKGIDLGKCAKCNAKLKIGVAMGQTARGVGDFGRNDVVTFSPGGTGKLITCRKCPKCGWSVTI